MFGFLKKLISKPEETPPAASSAASPPAAQPARAPATSARPSTSVPPAPLAVGETILLPLNNILSQLRAPVAALVLTRPGGTFSLAASTVVDQLRSGAVRIPLSQLRQGSPPGTFANDASHDNSLIDLPLPLVLAALSPAMLARRTDQKRVDLPDEGTKVFGPKGAMFGKAAPPAEEPPVAAPLPAASPTPILAAPLATPPLSPKPLVPTGPVLAAPKPVVPAAQLPSLPKPVLPTPGSHKPVTSIPPRPTAPKLPATAPLPFVTTRPTPSPAAAGAPVAPGEVVVTTLGAVCEAWPEAIRQEIENGNVKSASLAIPLTRLEAAMKTGRVTFTWGELRDWLDSPAGAASPHGGAPVELPLKVIAPLFLAKHRAAGQRKITLADNIPDLFVGMAKPAAPSTVAEPKAAAEIAAGAPPPSAGEPGLLGTIFGQPSKTEWSLQEIAQGLNGLPGVAYGLLATADGLLVAGQAPAPLNANTLAAFLPQIFGRAAHYAVEAQLGTLEALTLTVGQAPHLIFKAGPLYLAVVGQAGQSLPAAALRDIAGQLARRNQ